MSLMESNNGMSAADVAAVVGNNRNGNGMFGNDGGWFWIVILFLFAMFGNNGWGNNGNNGGAPVVLAGGCGNNVQQVVDQQSVMNGLMNINNSMNNGFANAEVSRCNANMNTLQALNNIGMSLQNCCCENRANIADLKYTVATENCADRTAAQQNTRDIIDAINTKYQGIQDKLCQLEMDGLKQNYEAQLRAKDAMIFDLQNRVQNQAFIASQNQQTADLKADNTAQTVALEQYLNPTAIPAYIVPNPNCCQQTYVGACNGRRIA